MVRREIEAQGRRGKRAIREFDSPLRNIILRGERYGEHGGIKTVGEDTV